MKNNFVLPFSLAHTRQTKHATATGDPALHNTRRPPKTRVAFIPPG